MNDKMIIAGIEEVKAITTFNRAVKILLTRTGDPGDVGTTIREATTYAVVADLIKFPMKTRRVVEKLLK